MYHFSVLIKNNKDNTDQKRIAFFSPLPLSLSLSLFVFRKSCWLISSVWLLTNLHQEIARVGIFNLLWNLIHRQCGMVVGLIVYQRIQIGNSFGSWCVLGILEEESLWTDRDGFFDMIDRSCFYIFCVIKR